MDCRQVLKSILTDLIQRSKQENPPLVIEMNKTEKRKSFRLVADVSAALQSCII